MEPSEAKGKRFSRLSEEEIQNLIEGKDSENTRKATKNAVVTFLAYWNEVKPEDSLRDAYRTSNRHVIVCLSLNSFTRLQ